MGAQGNHTVPTGERLVALRELLKKHEVQVIAVPSEDEHASEYLANADKRRAFISGFSGSSGCAIVTLNEAYLFTDGRYYLQAGKQLDNNWTLMKWGLPDVPSWQEFLHKNLEKVKIGVDPKTISISDATTITKELPAKGSELVSLPANLIDQVWTEKPARPTNPVFHLDVKYSGESHIDKIKRVREEITKKKAKGLVVSALDEVAWLFNLRGSDIAYNPVFFAYAVVTLDTVTLFVNQSQLEEGASTALAGSITICPYEAFWDYLKELPQGLSLDKENKILVGTNASLAIADALGKDNINSTRSPITDLKSIKNAVELEGFRQCHIRDGSALVRYFAWLEEQLGNGAEIDEVQGADRLEEFRSELPLFKGLSFDTISSTGPNGAIIHYSPTRGDCAVIKKDQVYLCDSGAQFWDGTTDTTRTWHFGTPTEEEKRAFTRVLQGHIAIDTAVFPTGTTGFVIDSWARRALWQDGLDYRHGTGHGVGHFLNVHEGPHGMGIRITSHNAAMKPGMTLSNEPGYYADGQFGLRVENIVLVREAKTRNNFGDKGYLSFENVTMVPIHKNLIDVNLLSVAERKWVDDYHREVLEKVSPLLKNDPRALEWLKRETTPL